jgi:hypothetical protein
MLQQLVLCIVYALTSISDRGQISLHLQLHTGTVQQMYALSVSQHMLGYASSLSPIREEKTKTMLHKLVIATRCPPLLRAIEPSETLS